MNLPIIISEGDARRLRPLVESSNKVNGVEAENLQRLRDELGRAQIVSESDLPDDIISMNSTVELEDLEDDEIMTYTLVFPENANVSEGRISILAPLGTAMLGYRVGYEIEWPVPSGTLRVRVRRVTKNEVTAGAPSS